MPGRTIRLALVLVATIFPQAVAVADASTVTHVEETTRYAQLPRFGLEPYGDRNLLGFYLFEAQFDNPKGSVVLAHYGVNRVTGAVWEVMACRRIRANSTRELTQAIRARSGLDARGWAAADRKRPCAR